MLKKFESITHLGIFNNFIWDSSVRNNGGSVQSLSQINILYGRNYSGKTTLSRIMRALETGHLSDKYESPSFALKFSDNSIINERNFSSHRKNIRVFNEDFIRDNLRFVINPDESIESFAVLGSDNNRIEEEIAKLEAELDLNIADNETVSENYQKAKNEHTIAATNLERQLEKKATDRAIGIKYKSNIFGDQNYNINKIRSDINTVTSLDYTAIADNHKIEYENLISEQVLDRISNFHIHNLRIKDLSLKTEYLVTKEIVKSNKIDELVKDATLHRWVYEGRKHHKDKREKCAFCDNYISENRWLELERHFDEESVRLENDIALLLGEIDLHKHAVINSLVIDKSNFYSRFHTQVNDLITRLDTDIKSYATSLDGLISQLRDRQNDILNAKSFVMPPDYSTTLAQVFSDYRTLCTESDRFSEICGSEQKKAQNALRLKEVSDYLVTIDYQGQLTSIQTLKHTLDVAVKEKNRITDEIKNKENLIRSKKGELNDEEKGAEKVNEYLNNFFGHHFLKLKPIILNGEIENPNKRIRFDVMRDDKKAYHLSEGEVSLLAFCYFLAKLDDINTKDTKPIIWIDDPISSLDGNHIFFVYSLISANIVSAGKFEQLFISTHNLDFLKYLKQLIVKYIDTHGAKKEYSKDYFIITRHEKNSKIKVMPKYMREYVTEFNYLFDQIYKCSLIHEVDDINYTTFYNFGNNARKFFEIYLYYKYPDIGMNETTLEKFFGADSVPALLSNRINNEYSHLSGVFERGATPIEVPEMLSTAKKIIERLKAIDLDQYEALLKSIGEQANEVQAP